jgi:hypothetical protein
VIYDKVQIFYLFSYQAGPSALLKEIHYDEKGTRFTPPSKAVWFTLTLCIRLIISQITCSGLAFILQAPAGRGGHQWSAVLHDYQRPCASQRRAHHSGHSKQKVCKLT